MSTTNRIQVAVLGGNHRRVRAVSRPRGVGHALAGSGLLVALVSYGCGSTDAAQSDREPSGDHADPEALAAAPSSGQTGSIEPHPGAEIQLFPATLTTSIGERPELSVLVSHRGLSADETEAALDGSLRLLDPAGAAVALDASIDHPSADTTRLVVTPAGKLSDQWYTAEFVTPPLLDANLRGTRLISLRPGSEPLITGIEVCRKGTETATVLVTMSEPVTWDAPIGSGVTYEFQEGSTASCEAEQALSDAVFGASCAAAGGQGNTASVSIAADAFNGTAAPVAAQRFNRDAQPWTSLVDGCTAATRTGHP